MSDVHCAATLVVLPVSAGGDVAALDGALGGARVASVFCGDDPEGMRAAETLGKRLGVPVTTCAALRDGRADEPVRALVDRVRAQLQEIADLHRGETALVVASTATVAAALPFVTGRGVEVTAGTPLALANDADGWALV